MIVGKNKEQRDVLQVRISSISTEVFRSEKRLGRLFEIGRTRQEVGELLLLLYVERLMFESCCDTSHFFFRLPRRSLAALKSRRDGMMPYLCGRLEVR